MLSTRRRARRSGFTLAELMAVVAIVGVMAAVAMATMSRAGDAQNSASLARSLQFAMMTARNTTLADGTQRRLACSLSTVQLSRYCTIDRATNSATNLPAPGMILPATLTWTTESRLNAGTHATLWNVTLTEDHAQNNAGASQVTGMKYMYFRPDGTVCDTYATTAAPTTACASSGFTFYVTDTNCAGNNSSNDYKIYTYALTGMPRMVNAW
jgi:prepilin-type N-terminal cleavage/methylation domain-containing protein